MSLLLRPKLNKTLQSTSVCNIPNSVDVHKGSLESRGPRPGRIWAHDTGVDSCTGRVMCMRQALRRWRGQTSAFRRLATCSAVADASIQPTPPDVACNRFHLVPPGVSSPSRLPVTRSSHPSLFPLAAIRCV